MHEWSFQVAAMHHLILTSEGRPDFVKPLQVTTRIWMSNISIFEATEIYPEFLSTGYMPEVECMEVNIPDLHTSEHSQIESIIIYYFTINVFMLDFE